MPRHAEPSKDDPPTEPSTDATTEPPNLPTKVAGQIRDVSVEVARYLRTESIGGVVMLVATLAALVWANSPWSGGYERLITSEIGPASLHLRLTVAEWASDGLLALFFFVAGLELKRELVAGDLSDRRAAMLPVCAAVGGMVAPVLVFLAVAAGTDGASDGWAVPVATDIAFALAILAITGSQLPRTVRVFLLSLAVVDDLGAITLIAVLFTDEVSYTALAVAAGLLVLYAVLQWRRITWTVLYVPLGLATWVAVHESGVHATVAGVLLGLLTRARPDRGEAESPTQRLEHRLQPFSAGVAVPLFALSAAGVSLSFTALGDVLRDRVAWAIIAGLVVGKLVGVIGGALLAVRLRLAAMPDELSWRDLVALGAVAGCGFTVSLLLADLAFADPAASERARTAVLLASALAALFSAALLRRRVRAHT